MKFSNPRAEAGFAKMHPVAQHIAKEMDNFCQKNFGKELVITETWTTKQEDTELERVSSTHRDGRAWDVRTWDYDNNSPYFTNEEKKKLKDHFNRKYRLKFGAVTKDNVATLIVDKEHGSGPHLHCQIRRNLPDNPILTFYQEKPHGKEK
jgi:hypothetical protein